LGMCVGAIIGGRVASRLGERTGGLIGSTALAAATLVFLVGYQTRSIPLITIAMIVQGGATGFIRPAVASAAGAALDPEYFGVGMATVRMTALLGSTAGVSLELAAASIGGFPAVCWMGFILAIASTILMTLVRSRPRPIGTPEEVAAGEHAIISDMETEIGLTVLPGVDP